MVKIFPCSLLSCFVIPFNIVITSLGEGGGLVCVLLVYLFVCFVRVSFFVCLLLLFVVVVFLLLFFFFIFLFLLVSGVGCGL